MCKTLIHYCETSLKLVQSVCMTVYVTVISSCDLDWSLWLGFGKFSWAVLLGECDVRIFFHYTGEIKWLSLSILLYFGLNSLSLSIAHMKMPWFNYVGILVPNLHSSWPVNMTAASGEELEVEQATAPLSSVPEWIVCSSWPSQLSITDEVLPGWECGLVWNIWKINSCCRCLEGRGL